VTGDFGPFLADALDANRTGLLTDAQRQSITPTDRGGRGHDLYVAAFCILVAIVIWKAPVSPGSEWVRPLVSAGALLGAAVLVFRPAGLATRRLRRDLRAGRVLSVEGAIRKSMDSNWGALPQYRHHYLDLAGERLVVSAHGYQAAPDAGIVRVFYLPASKRVVNFERLPDRPVSREMLDSPGELLKTLGTAMGLHGGAAAAEARAELSALVNAMAPEHARDVAPPPLGERDPRPLAQAILGSWHSGAINLTFSGDGTVRVDGIMGMERHGHWSVEADGRLRSDAMDGQPGDAWVAGDVLTISAGGSALTFHRA